jgi:hypothetical protein
LTQQFDWKIPIRALELTQILGQPCEFQVEGDLLRANLRKSTVVQLRARLKTLGLPTAGKKDALIERLAGDAE